MSANAAPIVADIKREDGGPFFYRKEVCAASSRLFFGLPLASIRLKFPTTSEAPEKIAKVQGKLRTMRNSCGNCA